MWPLRFALSILCLVSCVLATNLPRLDSQSAPQPAPGKSYYTVFPKNDTDTSSTGDFIKQVVGAEDILPWKDVKEKLMHWTVEASPEEVSQLQGSTGIDHETPAEEYLVFAKDGKNQVETNQTEQFLQNLVGKQNVRPPFIFDDEIHFWLCNMTSSQRNEATKNPGVKSAGVNQKGEYGRHLPSHEVPLPSLAAKFSNVKAKRAVSYSTQTDAVTELVEVSQPSTIPDVKTLKNYVYESNSGKNSFVYHIEGGVAYKNQPNEFPNVVPDDQHLQTDTAIEKGIHPWEDPLFDSHGTCTAGKAVGKNYGATKQGKLVVVQIWDVTVAEILKALRLIIQDIRARPERRKKSVVSMSLMIAPGGDSNAENLFYRLIKSLLALDIPMFVLAGNWAEVSGREDVDTLPGLFAGPDYPLIVVGSTDHGGARSSFSQGGPQVTIHATGNQITCMLREGSIPATDKAGSSYAAPVVAAEVANLLSYDTVPFDTSDGNLVMNMRAYLQSNAASWARTPNILMIWNGVTEKDNPKIDTSGPAPSPPPPPPPEKKCNSLAKQKYVARDGLVDHIQKEFCPEAVKQGSPDKDSGSIVRRYNQGTPEDVSISLDVPPGMPLPNEGDCEKYFLEIIDGCDGNDPNNPVNYKGGGVFTDANHKYHIDPQATRQPASNGKQGGCDSSYKGLYNEYTIWGHGWDSADNGEALQKEVKGCALLPDTWSFSYGIGNDGREWTAKFRTGVFQKKCTGHAGKTASGIDNFGCSGSG